MNSKITIIIKAQVMLLVFGLFAVAGSLSAQDLLDLPVTFDDPNVEYLPLNDFGGNTTELGLDPEDNSNTVAITTRSATAENWAGTALNLSSAIPFSEENPSLSFRIYSPEEGIQVNLKLEQSDGDQEIEIQQSVDEANAWVTLEFDFGDAMGGDFSVEYDVVAVFFNFGVTGEDAGEQVYYWDDIDVAEGNGNGNGNGNGGTEMPDLPLTFDDPNVEYLPMNDFGGVTTTLGEDPENPENTVAISTRDDGAQDWAGSAITLASPIAFSNEFTTMTMMVYSPEAGVNFNMKLEQSDGSDETEVQATVSEANTWEELTFDFADYFDGNFEVEFDVIAIMPNYFPDGNPGEQVFYWDNVDLLTTTSIDGITEETPGGYKLEQNYPNPFNPSTVIDFNLPSSSQVMLSVYNTAGQRIAVLAQGTFASGQHSIQFDASNLTSGIYMYRLETDNYSAVRKMTLIK